MHPEDMNDHEQAEEAERELRVVELAGGLLATAVVPEVDGYPADKLELLAAVSVRDSLGLHDGDPLRLTLAVV